MERNPEASASTRDEVLFIPAAMCEKSQVAPHNTKGDLTSQRRHEWSPKSTHNSRGTLSFPPQLHENYEILPFTLEKALLRCSVSKECPCSLLEIKRVLDTLYKTPEVSQDTRPHLRGTLSFPPQGKKSRIFPASSRDEGRLPCFAWKGMLRSPLHLEWRLVST